METADPRLRRHVLILAAVLVLLGLAYEWVNPWLRYDRAAVLDGQLWRLLSAHLVHMNHWHMALNLTGLLLCWYFFTDLLTRRLLWLWLGLSAPVVGLAFLGLDPELSRYVGLSGLLHGLLVLLLVLGWRGNPVLHSVVLAVVVGRLLWEQRPDYDVNYLRGVIEGSVYVNAHLYGAITGGALATLETLYRRLRRRG
jgi:rhomboid family GlyGly-CTERM serine protease